MRTYDEARTEITSRLQQAGWELDPGALAPLQKIDFAKLVAIHDHEERFLETLFFELLLGMRRQRGSTVQDEGKITTDDIETALRMLGVAAARQADITLSPLTRDDIRDACGFC